MLTLAKRVLLRFGGVPDADALLAKSADRRLEGIAAKRHDAPRSGTSSGRMTKTSKRRAAKQGRAKLFKRE